MLEIVKITAKKTFSNQPANFEQLGGSQYDCTSNKNKLLVSRQRQKVTVIFFCLPHRPRHFHAAGFFHVFFVNGRALLAPRRMRTNTTAPVKPSQTLAGIIPSSDWLTPLLTAHL